MPSEKEDMYVSVRAGILFESVHEFDDDPDFYKGVSQKLC